MEVAMKLGTVNGDVKERLASISEPQNAILARLKESIGGGKKNRVNCGYSRMHNRHNRS